MMRAEGLQPDTIIFNQLLQACCTMQQHDRLFSVLELMRTFRLMPSAMAINTLATSFTGDRAALEQALAALQDSAS